MVLHTAVTPGNARAYYKLCGVPGTEGLEDTVDDNETMTMVVLTATVAVCTSQLQVVANSLKKISV
jgi:hypothetical protein